MPKPRSKGGTSELLVSFKEICRKAGIRVTHQRLEIFRVLAGSSDHPSVEEIFERVRRTVPTISLDTVYRSLLTLERYEVLSRVQVDTRIRFDPNMVLHHHFICTACRRIEDFYWPVFDELELPFKRPPWGRIRSRHVEIRGICKACLKAGRNR